MLGPTPVSGCAGSSPRRSSASPRGRGCSGPAGRRPTSCAASPCRAQARTPRPRRSEMAAISRKFLRLKITATAMQVPTQAPRPSVRKSATMMRRHARAPARCGRARRTPARASAAQMPQHQEARERHVVVADALRPLAQAVEVQQAVLDDAARRAGGADRDDDVDHGRRALAAREVVDGRDDDEIESCLSSMKLVPGLERERRRNQRQHGVDDQRQEERAAPTAASRSRTSSATQQTSISASRMPAAAIDICSDATNSQQQPRSRCGRASAAPAARPSWRWPWSCASSVRRAGGHRALGGLNHLVGADVHVRQRKSPGSHTRWWQGRQGSASSRAISTN